MHTYIHTYTQTDRETYKAYHAILLTTTTCKAHAQRFHELRQELLLGAPIQNTCDWKPKMVLQFAKTPQIMEALLENTGIY